MKEESLITELESSKDFEKSNIEKYKKQKADYIEKYGYLRKDPIDEGNCISNFFIWWAYKIIKLSTLINIKSKHLGEFSPNHRSEAYFKEIEYFWEKKQYKTFKRCPLLLTSIRINICSIIFIIFCTLITSFLNILSLYYFHLLILVFSDNKKITKENIITSGIYLLIRLFILLFHRKSFQFLNYLGNKCSLEIDNLIFSKILKLSPSLSINSGEIINFIQNDNRKLASLIKNFPYLFSAPLLLAAYNYLLYKYMGYAFLAGATVILIFLIINYYYRTQYSKYLKLHFKKIDQRLKITTDVINNLKFIKLNGLDNIALNKINVAKVEELQALESRYYIITISQTLLWFAPVAIAVVTIGLYQYLNEKIIIENIFTSLGIFTSIQSIIKNLPNSLDIFIETLVSMNRIENFLQSPEVNDDFIIKYDDGTINQKIIVQIKNGTFIWSKNKNQMMSIIEAKNLASTQKKMNLTAIQTKPSINKRRNTFFKLSKIDQKRLRNLEELNKKSESSSSESESEESKNSKSGNEDSFLQSEPRTMKDKSINPNIESWKHPSSMLSMNKYVLEDINFTVKEGQFICIIGEIGSGKSSLINALLNNMIPLRPEETQIIINGSISYVGQEAWIQNDTVRNNILFHQPFNNERYQKILRICELNPDLEQLIGGDLTEIGEKGINLSGGQKARISIARALYSNKDIYIFDDPLSALDANVGKNIVKNCILNFLEDKTRILITHALQHVYNADKIYYMKNGRIVWEGVYQNLIKQDFFSEFQQKINRNLKRKKTLASNIKDINKKLFGKHDFSSVKRLTKKEEKEVGFIHSKVFIQYFSYIGGYSICLFLIIVLIIWQSLKIYSDIWLGYWSEHQKEKSNIYFFIIYALISFCSTLFSFSRTKIIAKGSIKCSVNLHYKMITSLIKAPINLFHDTVPRGQIFNRLSKDLSNVDIYTMYYFMTLTAFGSSFFGAIIVCSIYQYQCLFFFPFFIIFSLMISRFYMNCSRELNRIESILNSPILNLINETIPGKTTIRAFNYQLLYLKNFQKLIDEDYKLNFYLNGCYQWHLFCLNFLAFIFLCFLVIVSLINKEKITVKIIGLLLTYSLIIQEDIIKFFSSFSNFENTMTNMERCLSYTKLISEKPQLLRCDKGLKHWPSKGNIIFDNVSVKYRNDTEIVLHNLSFEIKGGEHIGLVGRTGCGKSTLALCLFRLIEPTNGNIYIDDVDISSIGLEILRNNLTIISQDCTILDGTLRFNFDPKEEHSDFEIYSILKKIGFLDFVKNLPLHLGHVISDSESNLSIGEKQLICITRAILRKTKIVILDEATANIDYKNEEKVQKAINGLLKQSTIISIAHRIKTVIDSDKIIVLENGIVKEFDTPGNLLKNKNSTFYELYTKSLL